MPDENEERAEPSPETEPGLPPVSLSESNTELQRVEEELAQTRASYQRLAADFENYKRRKLQETQDLARYGSAALLTALLPALDNLERAASHLDEEATDGLSAGLRLTLRQLEDALASQGVQRVPAVGEPFDPRLHDAVTTVEGVGLERDTVVAEFLPGYQIHDRVIRPAQVSVAQATGSGRAGSVSASIDGETKDLPPRELTPE